MAELVCHSCGERVPFDEPIPRDAECARCGADLRACANCRHWDARYHNECTEPEAEPVGDRRRRNFCEFFYFSRAAHTGAGVPAGGASEARAKLDALWGGAKPAPNDRAAEARAKLDALFRRPGAGGPSAGEE